MNQTYKRTKLARVNAACGPRMEVSGFPGGILLLCMGFLEVQPLIFKSFTPRQHAKTYYVSLFSI